MQNHLFLCENKVGALSANQNGALSANQNGALSANQNAGLQCKIHSANQGMVEYNILYMPQ